MHSCLLENCVWNAVVVVFRCVALVTSSSSGCKCEGRGRVSCKCRSFLPQFVLEPFQSNGSLLWRCALMKYLGWVLVDHKVHETICLVGPNALPYCLKGGSIQYLSKYGVLATSYVYCRATDFEHEPIRPAIGKPSRRHRQNEEVSTGSLFTSSPYAGLVEAV